MLWSILLYTLQPGASGSALKRHFLDGLPAYEADLRARGQRFVGLYRVELELKPGSANPASALSAEWAEVCLADGETASQAALQEVQSARAASVQQWQTARCAWMAPPGGVRLWLQPLGLSPLAAEPTDLRERLLHLTLRHLPAGKTVQELAEFDARIIARYAQYMLQARWRHIGTYHVFGLPEYMYVDTLDVVEAASRADALANDAAVPLTAEMQAIYAECAAFLDQSRERYQLWLSPEILGRAAAAPLRLGGQARPESPV